MLELTTPDHRHASVEDLLAGIRAGDALALAECYARTASAAHACARRLLGDAGEVEALLREVYGQLWSAPPEGVALEGWVRRQAFTRAARHLRQLHRPAAVPSTALLFPELGEPEVLYLRDAEKTLAELDEPARRALVTAHDQGVPSSAQDADAAPALERALEALAGPEPGGGERPGACEEAPDLSDHALGLLPGPEARAIEATLDRRGECAARARMLRRGRSQIEGLPPAPDLGQRVMAVVLGGTARPALEGAPVSGPSVVAAEVGTGELPDTSGASGEVPPVEVHPVPPAPTPTPAPAAPTPATTPDGEPQPQPQPMDAAQADEMVEADPTPVAPTMEASDPTPTPAPEPTSGATAVAVAVEDEPYGVDDGARQDQRQATRRRGGVAELLGYVLPIIIAAAIGFFGVLLLVRLFL